MKPLIDQEALEKLLMKTLSTRWLWLIAVWLPFPCLFLPFGFVMDANDRWYLEYTSPVFLLAVLFYVPAHLVTWGIASLMNGETSFALEHVLAFTQSLLLTWLILKFKRRWGRTNLQMREPQPFNRAAQKKKRASHKACPLLK